MKAVIISRGNEDPQIRELPVPVPDKGEVLIQVKHVLLTPEDLNVKELPLDEVVPGRFLTGEVVGTGHGVINFNTGDTVVVNPILNCGNCSYCYTQKEDLCSDPKILGKDIDGGLAEYIKVSEKNLVKLPLEISPQQGTFIPLLSDLLYFIPDSMTPGLTFITTINSIEGVIFTRLLLISGTIRNIIFSTSQRLRTFLKPDLRIMYTEETSAFSSMCAELGEHIDLGFEFTGDGSLLKLITKNISRGGTVYICKTVRDIPQEYNLLEEINSRMFVIKPGNFLSSQKRMKYSTKLLLTHALNTEDFITHVFSLEDLQKIKSILTKEPALTLVNF